MRLDGITNLKPGGVFYYKKPFDIQSAMAAHNERVARLQQKPEQPPPRHKETITEVAERQISSAVEAVTEAGL